MNVIADNTLMSKFGDIVLSWPPLKILFIIIDISFKYFVGSVWPMLASELRVLKAYEGLNLINNIKRFLILSLASVNFLNAVCLWFVPCIFHYIIKVNLVKQMIKMHFKANTN